MKNPRKKPLNQKEKKAQTQAKKSVKASEVEEEEEEKAPVTKQQQAKGGEAASVVYEVFVRGLSNNVTEQDLRDFFADCGEITGVTLLNKKAAGKSKGGCAFIKFATPAEQEAAAECNGSELQGKCLQIEKATPKEQRPQSNSGGAGQGGLSQRDPKSTTVYVGNLSYGITKDALRKFFEPCGQIKSVRIANDPEGKSKGFAYVDFASSDAVDAAIGKIGEKLDGRPIKVDYSGTKQKSDRGFRIQR